MTSNDQDRIEQKKAQTNPEDIERSDHDVDNENNNESTGENETSKQRVSELDKIKEAATDVISGHRSRKDTLEFAGIFFAGAIGLTVILFVYMLRFILTGSPGENASRITTIYTEVETFLIIFGIFLVSINLSYSLLAGIIGFESGRRLSNRTHAVVSAGLGSALGVFVLLLTVTVSTIVVVTVIGSIGGAPDSIVGLFQSEFELLNNLSALEALGLIPVYIVSNLIPASMAAVVGSFSALFTYNYNSATR